MNKPIWGLFAEFHANLQDTKSLNISLSNSSWRPLDHWGAESYPKLEVLDQDLFKVHVGVAKFDEPESGRIWGEWFMVDMFGTFSLSVANSAMAWMHVSLGIFWQCLRCVSIFGSLPDIVGIEVSAILYISLLPNCSASWCWPSDSRSVSDWGGVGDGPVEAILSTSLHSLTYMDMQPSHQALLWVWSSLYHCLLVWK
jgi:hypothetical protein